MSTEQKMKVYIGTKIIQAGPMTSYEYAKYKDRPTLVGEPNDDGYLVRYPDGYISWSPRAVFEQAYREVSGEEAEMLR